MIEVDISDFFELKSFDWEDINHSMNYHEIPLFRGDLDKVIIHNHKDEFGKKGNP